MRKLLSVFLLFFVLFSVCALNLDVDTAVDLAMKNNLQLESALLELNSAKRKYNTSWNSMFPTVQGTATLAKTNELSSMATVMTEISNMLSSMTGGSTAELPENKTSLVLGLTVQETFNPAMITSILAAKENYKNGQLTYEQTRQQVQNNIKKLYYAIVLQEESLAIQEETLKAQKARVLQAETDYENGYVPEIYLIQSQVTYENNVPTVKKAEESLVQTKRQLAFLLGLDLNEDIVLTQSIEQSIVDLDENKLLSSIEDRLDVKSLDGQAKALKLQSRALKESVYLPSIAASISWQPVYSDANDFKNNRKNYSDSGSKSVTVAWNLSNIFPWSQTQQNIKDIDDARSKIDLSRKMLTDNAEMEIRSLIDTAKQNAETIESSERTVQLAMKNYEMTLSAFESGSKDELDLRDAENQLRQAKLGRLSSQYNYLSALIDLEYATQQKIR